MIKKKNIFLTGLAALLVVFGFYWFSGPDSAPPPVSGTGAGQQQLEQEGLQDSEEPESGETAYFFRTEELWTDHWQKHGAEFGGITKEEYLRKANELILSDDPALLTKAEKEDGDTLYYLESTNEFLVLSPDGYIRTYFRPGAGIDYYNRQ